MNLPICSMHFCFIMSKKNAHVALDFLLFSVKLINIKSIMNFLVKGYLKSLFVYLFFLIN